METHLLLRQNKHHMVLEGIMNFEIDFLFVCFRMQRRCFNYRKTGVTPGSFQMATRRQFFNMWYKHIKGKDCKTKGQKDKNP